jgi:hypothetical protein
MELLVIPEPTSLHKEGNVVLRARGGSDLNAYLLFPVVDSNRPPRIQRQVPVFQRSETGTVLVEIFFPNPMRVWAAGLGPHARVTLHFLM